METIIGILGIIIGIYSSNIKNFINNIKFYLIKSCFKLKYIIEIILIYFKYINIINKKIKLQQGNNYFEIIIEKIIINKVNINANIFTQIIDNTKNFNQKVNNIGCDENNIKLLLNGCEISLFKNYKLKIEGYSNIDVDVSTFELEKLYNNKLKKHKILDIKIHKYLQLLPFYIRTYKLDTVNNKIESFKKYKFKDLNENFNANINDTYVLDNLYYRIKNKVL
jgi:hypothetical protein